MNILNSVWYSQLPQVDADSFEYGYIVNRLAFLAGCPAPTLIQPPVNSEQSVAGSPSYAPPMLIFMKNGKSVIVGAIDTFFYPDVTYVWLCQQFGEKPIDGTHIAVPAPPPPPPQPPPVYDANPVGPAIPNAPGYFYATPHADPKYWSPVCQMYTDPVIGTKYFAADGITFGRGFVQIS